VLIHQAYRFPLDVNDRQATALASSAGLARYVWNWGLAERQRHYAEVVRPARERGEKVRSLTLFDQINEWNRVKADIAPWCEGMSTRIPELALADLDAAFKAWWSGRCRPPRFKAKGRIRPAFRTRGAIVVEAERIRLPSMGRLRVAGRASRFRGRVLFATVSRVAGRWSVSLTVEREIADPVTPLGEPVGIDLGISTFAALSDGTRITAPNALERNRRQLRRLNKALARSQRSSNRRKALKARLARKHARVAAIRSTFLHQTTARLVREHPAIGIEDLAVANLTHNHRLACRIVDQGWSEFRRQLAYKLAWSGGTLVVADRFFPSSQICSGCGHRRAMPLAERTYRCGSCGLEIDRDLNAARNLCPVAVMPTGTLNAHGGVVSPGGDAWQIPVKCEPSALVA
jgi:putative transposase